MAGLVDGGCTVHRAVGWFPSKAGCSVSVNSNFVSLETRLRASSEGEVKDERKTEGQENRDVHLVHYAIITRFI